jgi:hypothetical protein
VKDFADDQAYHLGDRAPFEGDRQVR